MRFSLLDRICSFEPGKELTAVKNVTLSEEYLADHFPEFPVLPGVFMLEAATQAGAWLIRRSEDFAHSIICLSEARAVKYADFVTPGRSLVVRVEQTGADDRFVNMRFQGEVDGGLSVSGRIILERYNLAESDPSHADLDKRMVRYQRMEWAVLSNRVDVPVAT